MIASAQYVLLNHNSISAYAASWMLLAFLRAQARDREGTGKLADHLVVGALGGIVLLFLQTKGLALIGAAAAFTLFAAGGKRGLRAAAAIVVGAAVAVAPLFLRWRPSQLIREWFIEPMAGDYLGHTSASGAFAIGCLLFAVGMVALALRLRDRLLVAVAVFQLALFVSFLNNLELLHVAGNSFPLFVFVPMALQRRAAGAAGGHDAAREKFSAAAVTAIVVGVIAALLATPMGRPLFKKSTLYVDFIRREPRNVIPRPRGGRRARRLRRSGHARAVLRDREEESILRLAHARVQRRLSQPPARADHWRSSRRSRCSRTGWRAPSPTMRTT